MRVFNRVLNGMFAAGSLPDSIRFHRGLNHVPSLQTRKLLAYLRTNRDTVFGREHRFSEIRSVEAYQDRVPIAGYEAFRPYIERIAAGEKRVLTREEVRLLEPTGGSSSGSKYIPYTRSLQREFQSAIHTWILDLYRQFGELLASRSYWSVTPVTGEKKTTQAGIPVGFEDDSDYAGLLGKALKRVFPVPPEVKALRDMDNFRYVTAFYLLRARDLGLISVWNPTFLILLMEQIEQRHEQLTRDLFDGTLRLPSPLADCFPASALNPAPERARELETAFGKYTSGGYGALWPDLRLISCWADGASLSHAQKITEMFPGVAVQPKGLLATECLVSFPMADAGGSVIAYPAHFFEFLPDDGSRPRPVHRLDTGALYTVLVTTGGGLYRYNLEDRIEVTGSWRGLPVIRFHGRRHVSDLVGEKLEERHVQSVVEHVLAGHGLHTDFILFAPETTPEGGFYTLFIQTPDPLPPPLQQAVLETIDAGLNDNFHYRYARRLGQLTPPAMHVLKRKTGQKTYLRRCMEAGQRLGDIKQTVLDSRTGWKTFFNDEDV